MFYEFFWKRESVAFLFTRNALFFCTGLRQRVVVIIRYKTGDIARLCTAWVLSNGKYTLEA